MHAGFPTAAIPFVPRQHQIEGVQALVTRSGVGGIESDTDEEDLDALIVEEWRALRAALKKMGVRTEELPLDVQAEWIEWRM